MRRPWFLIVLAAAVGLVGVLAVGRLRAPTGAQVKPVEDTVPVEVAKVTRSTFERTVEVTGSLTSARVAEVFARRSGLVARVLVNDGARVEAGQPLVALDGSEAATRLRQAEAASRVAEARLALLAAGARPQERLQVQEVVRQAESGLAAAQAQLRHAQVAVEIAETSLERMEALFRDGAVSQAQVDQARLEADLARTQVRATEAQLRAAEAQVRAARQQQSLVEAGPRTEEIQAARAQLEQARAALTEARQALADMTVRAPFAGRVARLRVSPGDFTTSGEFGSVPVAVVYDDRALEAEVTVGEREAGLLRSGQPAILRPEIAPGLTLRAVVKTVTPLVDPGSRAITVHLRLIDPPATLQPGTFIRGAVVVERRVGVLTMPRAALHDDARPTVRVVSGGIVDVREVTIGLSERNRVEVIRGVTEGEQVVVLGPEDLVAGTKVTVVNQGKR